MQQQSFAAFVTFSLFFADAFMFVGFYVVFISFCFQEAVVTQWLRLSTIT